MQNDAVTWQDGSRCFRVQLFPSTRRLIWSSWVETSDGPVYDDGFAQPFDAFLQGDLSPHNPPEQVMTCLREQIARLETPAPNKRGLLNIFRKRG